MLIILLQKSNQISYLKNGFSINSSNNRDRNWGYIVLPYHVTLAALCLAISTVGIQAN